MQAAKCSIWILLIVLLSMDCALRAQAPQLPITVTKEKKSIVFSGEDAATKQDPAVAEYLKLVAAELQELFKEQPLNCSWAVSVKLIPKANFKLLELTIEDKDNRTAPNKITKSALPTEKEEYAEQSKAAAKRLLQLFICSTQT
jgi:hypothetical protein